jgi:diadenosine tetraphosphatase ApaH/serine/threonine PP2A family protein phosphatase
MTERIALIADIHGNTPALRAVLDDVAQAGCSRLFMLGDIVNGLDPAGCIDLLRHSWPDAMGIKGNAEHYLLTPELDAFPWRNDSNYAEVITLIAWWRARLAPDHLAWLAALPETVAWDDVYCAHDSPLDRLFPARWHRPEVAPVYQELCYHAPGIASDLDDSQVLPLLAWMAEQSVTDVFCGHTHDPFCANFGDRRICNVGSVGLPLDGDPRAAWALVEEVPGQRRRVTIRRVAYPIDAMLSLADRMPDYPSFAQAGRRAAYKQMLANGMHWKRYTQGQMEF